MQKPILPISDRTRQTYEISHPLELHDTLHTFPRTSAGAALIIQAEFVTGTASRLGLSFGNPEAAHTEETRPRTDIVYDTHSDELSVDRTRSGDTTFHQLFASVESCPLGLKTKVLTLEVIVDLCSVEVFAQNGQLAITDLIFPTSADQAVSAFAEGGVARLQKLTITEFK